MAEKCSLRGAVSKCTRTWIESPEQDADRLRTKFEEFKSYNGNMVHNAKKTGLTVMVSGITPLGWKY